MSELQYLLDPDNWVKEEYDDVTPGRKHQHKTAFMTWGAERPPKVTEANFELYKLLKAAKPLAEFINCILPEFDDDEYWGDSLVKVGMIRDLAKALKGVGIDVTEQRD